MTGEPLPAGWHAERDAEALPAAALAELLRDPWEAVVRGTLLREMGDRRTGRVRLAHGQDALVKVERLATLDDRLRSLARPSRARLEWTAARHLAARGVPVARPLALAERRRRGRVAETVYVAAWLPGRETLGERVARLAPTEQAELLQRVGALVRALHAAGFDHRDLHAGNLLVGPAPGAALSVVDLHRGRLGAEPPPRAVRAALARLLVSLRLAAAPGAGLRAALLAGCLGPGADDAARQRLASALAPDLARFERRHQRKHDAFALVPGPFFAAFHGPLGRGVRRRSFSEEALARVLRGHDAALAAHDARVLKDQRKSAVTRQGEAVVKEARRAGARDWAKRLLTPGRLAAGHLNAHRLEVRGYATALPLAFLRRGGRVFTLYEDLSACARLDHRVRALYPGGARAAQAALRDASADLFARLHAEGVYHGDLKAVNLLVGGSVEAPRLLLVDTDRCRFGARPLDAERRLRNLAQLDASIPRSVTRSERLRWWRRYAARSGFAGDERSALRRVAALVARKLAVVDAPIE